MAAPQDVFNLPYLKSSPLSGPFTSREIISPLWDVPMTQGPSPSAPVLYTLPLAPTVLLLEPVFLF